MAAYHSLLEIFHVSVPKDERLEKLMQIIFNMTWSEDMSNVRKSAIRNLFTDSNNSILERILFETLKPYKSGWGRYNIKSYFDVSEERTETTCYVDINKISQKT